jgi:hypothetical protein
MTDEDPDRPGTQDRYQAFYGARNEPAPVPRCRRTTRQRGRSH